MITVQSLTKHYGQVRAVDGISFEIKKGEVVGFLGPNGAGKTTTMQMITGYLFPTSGTAVIDGINVVSNPLEVKQRIGYLPENTPLYEDLTVYEFLSFIAGVRGLNGSSTRTIKKTAELCGITDVINRPIGTLSKGYRQRVGLAQAILHDPQILVLDEPTTGLDPLQIREIRALIRELGREKTIILSTHILPEVEQTCDRVLIINQGRIVADGSLESLKSGKTELHVVLKGEVEPSVFSTLGRVDKEPSEEGETRFRIVPEAGTDIREQVYRICREKDLTLLELYRERQSLEDVFRQLTAGGQSQ
jgi:ABC-2 type transport system ATP-binding protein